MVDPLRRKMCAPFRRGIRTAIGISPRYPLAPDNEARVWVSIKTRAAVPWGANREADVRRPGLGQSRPIAQRSPSPKSRRPDSVRPAEQANVCATGDPATFSVLREGKTGPF